MIDNEINKIAGIMPITKPYAGFPAPSDDPSPLIGNIGVAVEVDSATAATVPVAGTGVT